MDIPSNSINNLTPATTTTTTPYPLKDRVAIITGGSGGIGSSIATHLATLGAKLLISYLGDSSPSDSLIASIHSSTSLPLPRAINFHSDISDELQVKSLFDRALHSFGPRIHILITAAGIQDPTYPHISNTSVKQWEDAFNVNAKGTFLCCREAARRLVVGGGGRIITMSSSKVGALTPGYGAYAATKAAVEAMTGVLARELRGTGITANAVAPGPIATELFFAGKTEEGVRRVVEESPMGRLGEPRDVAAVVGFLAGDGGEWVNGQVIRVNGGYI